MATYSGTYNFNPGFSDVILSAYSRIGLRPPALTIQHFVDASREGNYLQVEFSNKQPNLWVSELQSIPLVQGTSTYSLPVQVIMVLDIIIETNIGGTLTDRLLGAVSTTEYDAYPTKNVQGPPNTYWLNRQIVPQVTFWPVPDGGGPYTAKIRTVRQFQDANVPSGTNLELPYRFLDAFVAGLAHRLSRIHAPALEQLRKADAMEAWSIAATQDTEAPPVYILPQLSGYYRR